MPPHPTSEPTVFVAIGEGKKPPLRAMKLMKRIMDIHPCAIVLISHEERDRIRTIAAESGMSATEWMSRAIEHAEKVHVLTLNAGQRKGIGGWDGQMDVVDDDHQGPL